MRGYKRGDSYRFQLYTGITRDGTIVRSDKNSITVLYNANERKRLRTFTKEEVYAGRQRKI